MNTRKVITLLVALLTLTSLVLSGCGPAETPAPQAEAPQPTPPQPAAPAPAVPPKGEW